MMDFLAPHAWWIALAAVAFLVWNDKMIWQDYALAAINAGFLPTLVAAYRAPPPFWTSLPTAVLLAAAAAVMSTMEFWYTALCQAAMALQWAILATRKM